MKENISVKIRFLDWTRTVREDFVRFYLCEDGATGSAIKDFSIVIGAVADLGLSIDDCHGQCYDGVGNISGCWNGASSHIRAENDKAVFTV